MTTEQTNLMAQAINEIRSLRQQNQVMRAKLEMHEDMMLLFRTEPRSTGGGMSEDLTWKLQKQIDENVQGTKSI